MAWVNNRTSAQIAADAIIESDDGYFQPIGLNGYKISNGLFEWIQTEYAEFKVRERVTRYSGLTLAQSDTFIGTDDRRTCPLRYENGTEVEVFEKYSKRVSRRRANPCGGYDVIVTEKWMALYINGAFVRGELGPSNQQQSS